MIIPTRRMIALCLLPPTLIALRGGSDLAVMSAWGLLAFLIVLWLIDGLVQGVKGRFLLSRDTPERIYVDQPQRIQWNIENRSGRRIVFQLRDIPPEAADATPGILEGRIDPKSRTTLDYVLTPSKRGDLKFGDAWLRVQGRLGLAWKQYTLPEAKPVRCLPHLANWTAADLATREALVRQSGSHRYRWRGSGTMFESLRDYSSDDDIRWVDWKASARAQRPISRNYETERHQNVILLLDASRMMTTFCGYRTKFDVVLEAAILAGRAASDQGDAVGIMVFSDKPDAYLHPRRERSQVGRIMDTLYAREARLVEPDFETALSLAAQRNRRRSLVILFTDVTVIESAQRMSLYVRSLIPRHLPLVVTISDDAVEAMESQEPRDAEEFYQVGIAHELLQQRDELLEVLRSSGAAVLDSPANQVATRTISSYLELKRRARL